MIRRRQLPLLLGDQTVTLGAHTLIMGVLNCTPDSFSDGGRYADPQAALRRYHQMVADGADWIDVGGESTRPGAEPVSAAEEWRRIEPVITAAREAGHPVPLSVDTTKYDVAARALDRGVMLINDVSALDAEPRLANLAARYRAGLVLMHMRGRPRTMQERPVYADVVAEIGTHLRAAIALAEERGVRFAQIIVDPGIGFGKTVDHNLEILRRLDALSHLERPLLIGCSRKSLIGAVLDLPVDERLEGTLALHTAAVLAGAHIARVHDVRAHVRALAMADALLAAR
jgi:dihydropteroate synthase